jgi:integrase/recombinase XerD
MSANNSILSKCSGPSDPLNSHVEGFITHLRAAGYAERTLKNKRPVIAAFTRWTKHKQFAFVDLNESHGLAFVKRSPRRRKARVTFELSVLALFLRYLRLVAGLPARPREIGSAPADELHCLYVNHLRNGRGLAENSIRVYSPYIVDFLSELVAKYGSLVGDELNAQTVQEFLVDRVRDRSSEYARLLATALRSFLRFLFLHGKTERDLSLCVPSVRKWRHATVPIFLSPDEVEYVLSKTDRSSPSGCRDYAVMLLLARLGLRAGETVTLNLDDIRWRTGEIVVRGKGGQQSRLPLLTDVGQALAHYLCSYRGHSSSRRVFLRLYAPRVGLTGPASIGHIVRTALARAGLPRPKHRAAHLFRHSLATGMIRHGASITEIAQVLRHRSTSTTEIYTKVAFEALSQVARPWPGTGGAR